MIARRNRDLILAFLTNFELMSTRSLWSLMCRQLARMLNDPMPSCEQLRFGHDCDATFGWADCNEAGFCEGFCGLPAEHGRGQMTKHQQCPRQMPCDGEHHCARHPTDPATGRSLRAAQCKSRIYFLPNMCRYAPGAASPLPEPRVGTQGRPLDGGYPPAELRGQCQPPGPDGGAVAGGACTCNGVPGTWCMNDQLGRCRLRCCSAARGADCAVPIAGGFCGCPTAWRDC